MRSGGELRPWFTVLAANAALRKEAAAHVVDAMFQQSCAGAAHDFEEFEMAQRMAELNEPAPAAPESKAWAFTRSHVAQPELSLSPHHPT